MRAIRAPLGEKMSGHIFFKDRWYGFDDGMYAGTRPLVLLSATDDPSATLNLSPQSVSTPELHIALAEGENFALISDLLGRAVFPGAVELIAIDGLRVEYPDGFGLAVASNTTPVTVIRFEAETAEGVMRIQNELKRLILEARSHAILPY